MIKFYTMILIFLFPAIFFIGCSSLQTHQERMKNQAMYMPKESNSVEDQKQQDKKKQTEKDSPSKGTGDPSINLTPLTAVIDTTSKENSKGGRLSNSYTRLTITSHGKRSKAKVLGYETEGPIRRFLWGTKYDFNLSANIKIDTYETTQPLLSVTHKSGPDGEQWIRTISHDLLCFPLFLVRGDGLKAIPRVTVTLRGIKEHSSNISATALQAAVNGIQLVSPEAKVLTTLTAQASKEKATAIDSVISKLFVQGIQEMHSNDRDFNTWEPSKGWQIILKMPTTEKDWDENLEVAGVWTITFTEPQPSLFSDWRICESKKIDNRCVNSREDALNKTYLHLNAAHVLAYELAKTPEGKPLSLSNYISQKLYYQNMLTNLIGDENSDKKTADNFCRMIQNDMADLGLNTEDSEIVLWATIKGMPQSKTIHKDAYDTETCRAATAVQNKITSLVNKDN